MIPSRSSGRKRWNIHDGPRGSLRRLRNQLAEDGCPESQVVLAKQLLEEQCELEADKIANFKQALDWLICATEQGHQEARRLLKRSIRSGVISENNAAIVRAKTCLTASRQETVARKAARDLFASLSNGEEYITTVQLERRIREICNVTLKKAAEESDDSPEEREDLDPRVGGGQAIEASREPSGDHVITNGTLRSAEEHDDDYEGVCSPNQEIHNLTVDNLVTAAVNYCQGELPLVSYELTLTDPGLKALDHIPLLQQAFLHPIIFIKVLYLKLLFYFGSFSFRLTNIELMLFLIGYIFLGIDNISLFVPLILYYASFVSMVVATFKMLHAKRQFVDFRKWSGLFLRYSDGNLEPNESENLFVRNNLSPFVQFFLAIFVNLFLYPFIATQWVPFSEFSVLSFFLMFMTLFSFSSTDSPFPDFLALMSFSINVLAKYPYEKDTVVNQGWRFLDLHIQSYPSYILGNGIEFCLNARVFFTLLIPVILLFMAKKNSWQGFYKHALPHCVTLSWLQMFIMTSQGCTMYGLIRGTLGLVCVFLFVPIMGIITLMLPVFACLQGITLSNVFYSLVILIAIGLSLVLTCVLAKLEMTKKYITPLQLLFGLLALLYLGTQYIQKLQQDGIPSEVLHLVDVKKDLKNYLKNDFSETDYTENNYHINWDYFYNECHTPSWIDSNVASTQIKCSVLSGANINWQGYIADIKLTNIDNTWASFSQYLPDFMQEYFKCYYGEEYSTLCQSSESLYSVKECNFMQNVAKQTGKICHLYNLNRYTYEVTVHMPASGGLLTKHTEISLILDHYFSNFTRLLRPNDKIRFKGILNNDDNFYIGQKHIQIQTYEIACIECQHTNIQGLAINSKLPTSKFEDLFKTIVNDFAVSAKYILNFILNPVVVFK